MTQGYTKMFTNWTSHYHSDSASRPASIDAIVKHQLVKFSRQKQNRFHDSIHDSIHEGIHDSIHDIIHDSIHDSIHDTQLLKTFL